MVFFFLHKNMIACNVKATGCNFCEPYRERLSEEQEKRKNVTDREQVKKRDPWSCIQHAKSCRTWKNLKLIPSWPISSLTASPERWCSIKHKQGNNIRISAKSKQKGQTLFIGLTLGIIFSGFLSDVIWLCCLDSQRSCEHVALLVTEVTVSWSRWTWFRWSLWDELKPV